MNIQNINKTFESIENILKNTESITYSEAVILIQQKINYLLDDYTTSEANKDYYRKFYSIMLEIASIATASIESNN